MRTVGVQRVLGLSVAAGVLAVTLYRDPLFSNTLWLAAAALGAAAAVQVALRGGVGIWRRLTYEVLALGVALLVSESIIEVAFPPRAVDYLVSRMMALENAARRHGIRFDSRLRSDIVEGLHDAGTDVLPGVMAGWPSDASVRKLLPSGFYPLSNASNAEIIECNEGPGYVHVRTDEYGFNNPRGLIASNDVDIAVVGESYAFGRCVAPSKNAVAIIRNSYPRTVTLGIANARILSQLATFREYVEPLRVPIVLWFINDDFADSGPEAVEPNLTRYLDPAFSQDLLHRQPEVDAAVRKLFVHWQDVQDEKLRKSLADFNGESLLRTLKLPEIRRELFLATRWRQPQSFAELERVMRLARNTAAGWGGTLVPVMLPTYQATLGGGAARARYEAACETLRRLGLRFVDGAAAFQAQPDPLDLYMLRIENHPSELGHAVLAEAILKQLRSREQP